MLKNVLFLWHLNSVVGVVSDFRQFWCHSDGNEPSNSAASLSVFFLSIPLSSSCIVLCFVVDDEIINPFIDVGIIDVIVDVDVDVVIFPSTRRISDVVTALLVLKSVLCRASSFNFFSVIHFRFTFGDSGLHRTSPCAFQSCLLKRRNFVKKYCEIHSVVFATWKIFVAIIQLLVIKKLDLLVVLVGNNYFCWSRDFVTNKVAVWKSHSLIFWWSNFGNRNLLWRDYWWSENLIYWFKCEFWKNYFCCKNEQFSRVN